MDTTAPELSRDMTNETPYEEMDVYEQLAEKERDLILAAELGKALLEKNELMSRQSEQMVEDFGHQLEELHQQKYDLHLLLETRESEHENRIRELKDDIALLREELDERDDHLHSSERDKSQVIQELTQQNERLNEQLQKAAQQEQSLHQQVQSLRDQISLRRSTMHDHVNQMEVLSHEIRNLTEKKIHLERRVTSISRERDGVHEQIEHLHAHTSTIERENKEKGTEIESLENEIRRLQEDNARLQSELEEVREQRTAANSDTDTHRPRGDSLFDELQEVDSVMSVCGPLQSTFCDNHFDRDEEYVGARARGDSLFEELRSGENSSSDPFHENGAGRTGDHFPFGGNGACDQSSICDEPECDDADAVDMVTDEDQRHHHQDENIQLRQEVMTAYHKLVEMCQNLNEHHTGGKASHTKDTTANPCLRAGLQYVIDDLKNLIEGVLKKETRNEALEGDILQQVQSLQVELVEAQEQLTRLKEAIARKDEELKGRVDDMSLLNERLELTQQHHELRDIQHSRDHLFDQVTSELTRDDILQQTRAERDEAVKMKEHLAQELSKTKRDLVSLDTQLMQAVEQKIFLSQQLEKWQEDMHEVIASNVNKQIKSQRGHRRHASDHTAAQLPRHGEQSGRENTEKKSRFLFW